MAVNMTDDQIGPFAVAVITATENEDVQAVISLVSDATAWDLARTVVLMSGLVKALHSELSERDGVSTHDALRLMGIAAALHEAQP